MPFKITDSSQFTDEMINKWFAKFDTMIVGQTVEIAKVGKRDPALFIELCRYFIDSGNYEFDFTNDYKLFRRGTKWLD